MNDYPKTTPESEREVAAVNACLGYLFQITPLLARTKRRILPILCSALLLAGANELHSADPVRVVLSKVPRLMRVDPAGSLNACLSLYLRERLRECGSVRVVSDGRADAILDEVRSGKRDTPKESTLREFSKYLPVDVLIDWHTEPGMLYLDVHSEKEVRRHTIPFPDGTAVSTVVHRAAELLADDLEVPPQEKKLLTERRIPSGEAFRAFYTSQVIWAKWPFNPYTPRLNMLRSAQVGNPESPRLAAEILRGADNLLASQTREQDFAGKAVIMAQLSLVAVLDSPFEEAAYGIIRRKPDSFEEDLLSISRPLTGALFDDTGDFLEDGESGTAGDLDVLDRPENKRGVISMQKRMGALRLLGVMRSNEGLKQISAAAEHEERSVREACAYALRFYQDEESIGILEKLLKDREANVSFMAGYSLWKRGKESPPLLELARKIIDTDSSFRPPAPDQSACPPSGSRRGGRAGLPAAEVIAKFGTGADIALLVRLRKDTEPRIRAAAASGIMRLSAVDETTLIELLNDPDESVVLKALSSFPEKAGEKPVDLAKKLTNDPFGGIALAARLALDPYRPEEGRDQHLFDLATEHTYIRMKIVDTFAAMKDQQSLSDLEAACSNNEPHTRAHAMKRLVEREPARSRKALIRAIHDPYRWVRLHAASLLAGVADDSCIESIRAALKEEKDEAIGLYLADALARAEGRPLPEPRPAARSIAGKKNLAWGTGVGLDSTNSPFEAYYCLSVKVHENMKKAHVAGKILFGRANTVGHPGLIVVSSLWRDRFWQTLDAEFPKGDNIRYLDGVVFGEETMNMKPNALWQDGWRLFCADAGIDPARVQGQMKLLNTYEQRAWTHWALERAVDGFNILYDYVKLKYGKLRPGIQVCTFLPGQGGISPADRGWKFDLGGIYDYKGDNRMAAYNLVRRMKTLWPERAVLWLSLGIGGYEMNVVRRTQKMPVEPLTTRSRRCYADALTAWIAGADTGWFSVWVFVKKDWKGAMHELYGVQVGVEDIALRSPILNRGIEFAFRGAEAELADPMEKSSVSDADLDAFGVHETVVDLDADEHAEQKALQITRQIAEQKEKFRRGFLFYQKYVYDCARLFSSLPRQSPRMFGALAVRPDISVWTRPTFPNPVVPGMALLNAYDFLCDINKVRHLDLSRYRLIVLHDPGPLQDTTIAALTRWLEETPGLLYIHRAIETDNTAESSTAADHDGKLQNDWPWERDVSIHRSAQNKQTRSPPKVILHAEQGDLLVKSAVIGSFFSITGASAQAIYSADGKPVLVLWRNPDAFKGAVLFDGIESASKEYLLALQKVINGLETTMNVGLKLDGPILHQMLDDGTLLADATTGYFHAVMDKHTCAGLDLLTGERNPVVGKGRSAALIASEYVGKYVASISGIAVLCEKPIAMAKRIEGGILIESPGLIRAAAESGDLLLRTEEGPSLSEVENPAEWIILGQNDGFATMPAGKTGCFVTYLRCKGPIRILKSGQ